MNEKFSTLSKSQIKRNLSFYIGSQILSFRRDAVERVPEEQLKKVASYMRLEEFGSKSLPLRASVESVINLGEHHNRVPLRDAVEKRPSPQTYKTNPVSSINSQADQFQFLINHISQITSSYQNQPESKLQNKKIVCYFEAAAAYRKQPLTFTAEDLDPFLCTHVIYAFASLDPENFNVISNDEEYDIIQGGYKSVVALKRFNKDLKVLLSIGGPRDETSSRFSKMISNANRRRNFIRSVFNLMKLYEFDGVELHWEYPELYEVFSKSGLLVAVAVPASRFRIEDGFYAEKLNGVVDFVNLQAYDFHRDREPVADHHSNLFSRPNDEGLNIFINSDYAVKMWIKNGLDKDKIILGIPFFGRSFTLQFSNDSSVGAPIKGPGHEGFYTQTPGFLAYFEICDMIVNEGWLQNKDFDGSPYIINGDQWIGYEDQESIKQKIKYVKSNDLGGAFVWAVDLDDFKGLCGDKWPLLSTINKYLKVLGQNAPNLEVDPYQTPVKPYGACISEGYYSDPKNCAAYYVCKNGLSYHLSCGSGRMFLATSGKCAEMQTEKCRPGEMIYVHQKLKNIKNELLRENSIEEGLKVVCYVTNWAFYRKADGKFVPEHVDQRLCTHLVYAFASLDPETLLIKEFDSWADIDNNLYERITSLKDVKVMLSLGGWTDSSGDKYSRLVSDGSARRRFVVGTVSFLRRHRFRGLHFDWNYPICWQSNCKKGPASDKPNFTKLIQELKREFDKQSPPLILAASISGYKEIIDVAYDLPALSHSFEFLSVMTYDYHGAWEGRTGHVSPLYHQPNDNYPQYNTNFTMEYLVSKGAIREKLLVGIPFYGQSFSLTKQNSFAEGIISKGPGEPGEYTKQPGMLAYYEICHRIKAQNWITNKGRYGSGPYAYLKDQWVGYEDVDSVKEKANYVRTSGFGGIVAWTIDLDDFNNRCCQGSFPLLHSLNEALGRISSIPPHGDCTKPPAPSTPPPPETTTGIDSGASSSEHNHHHTQWTTQKTTTALWWTTSSTSSIWWSTITSTRKPQITTAWWQTTHKTTTTKKPIVTTTDKNEEPMVPPPAVIKPDQEIPVKKCDPGQYLPDPNNCNAFYRCVAGELTKQYCAGGLHWNKERHVCDWPSNARCKELLYSATVNSIVTTTTQQPTKETTQSLSSTISYLDITSGCDSGAYYPHELCNKFYICYNNRLTPQSCPPGLHWDVERGMCDWKFKVKCSGRKKLSEKYTTLSQNRPQPYSSCQQNSFAAYPGDCSKYMQCLWGKYQIFQCGPGLVWNKEMTLCDWPRATSCQDTENEIDDGTEAFFPSSTSTTRKPTTEWEYRPPIVTEEWPSSTQKPSTTTQWEWKPPTTSEPEENPWEWHPPIPPTSEKPPLSEPLKPMSDYFKIVCYFTNWAWYRQGQGKYLPEDIDENLCTHIVYGFAVLDFSNLIIKAHDSWADFDNQFYKRVVAYKSKGIKVSIAIGGWNDSQGDKYSRLVNNPENRNRFIEHLVKFLHKWGFDGLDLDWEYPKCWQVDCKKGPDSDKQAFSAFVKELKQAFKPKGYLLSAAVSPSKTVIDAGYDVPVLGEYLDWVAVMTYDFHGQWDKQTGHVAPLFYHPEDEIAWFNAVIFFFLYYISFNFLLLQNFSIHYWISEGVPRRKIVMGMPLYGQAFRLENAANNGLNAKAPGPGEAGEYTKAAGFLAYYEICNNIQNKGWTVVQDPKRRIGPYAYKGNQWVSFDDQEMIRIKSEYIRRMDLGGGMIWALDLDDFKNKCGAGRHPLLTTIRNVLADSGTGVPEPIPPIEEEERFPTQAVEFEEDWHHSTHQASTTSTSDEFKVVCYFTNWAWYRQGRGKYLPSNIDPDLCTHIVYGFAVLNADEMIIKPHDTWADIDNKFYEKVTALKKKSIKVLLAIGGWNDSAGDKYSRLVNSPSAKRKFIAHVMEFIEANNFDGLDLDWEYPKCWQVDCNKGPDSDKTGFSDFVKELHQAFQPKGWLLSAAVSPSKRIIDAAYDVSILSKYLDWIAVMTYDYHGQWDKITGHVAPMYTHPEDIDATFNTNFTINYWIEQGADRKKIVMGMPMYGQSFTLANNEERGLNAPTYGGGEAGEDTRARGFLSYYEICTNIIKKGWKLVRDKQGRIGPYAYLRDQWVSFDDIGMIRHKSQYVKAMGLGGAMIWALDLDDFANECNCEEYPLLRTINRVLRNYSISDPKCVLGKGQEKPPVKTTTIKPPTYLPESCSGNQFQPHPTDCNQYYLCNQGEYTLQACPSGLFWNNGHCDWPENSDCNYDGSITTTANIPIVPSSSPTTSIMPSESNDTYKVVCYFTNWAWYRQGDGKYLPSDIDASLCTHINYGFAVLDPNKLTIKPHDSWADIDNEFYTKIVGYKAKGVKVLIALGGWNDSNGDKYSRLVNRPEARSRFIENTITFIEEWQFDGLDFDWEYPKCWQVDCHKGPDTDKQGFAALIRELSQAFKPRGLLLSSAVSPSKTVIDAGYDVPILNQYFDWISIMTYDFHGHWDKQTGHVAPLYYYTEDLFDYFNSNFSIHYWIEKGADPRKLIMGMPLYGQSFSLADSSKYGLNEKTYGPGEAGEYTRAGGFLAFYEICEKVKSKSWIVKRDPLGRIGPYAHMGNQWVSYDDIAEIKRKAQLIKNLRLGGGMIWALDLDDFRNRCGCGRHPLLKTLNAQLRGISSDISEENCT
ncbi:hypothetical protein ABEB36_012603 [Hypothenemus hampei]|uniref:chitinase n=1 Tax=Hypothenemus hampei TaxID=57062 RepID=A0ABD1EBT9_HYPHA